MTGADGGFKVRFWDVICEYEDFLKAALSINVLLVILLLIALPWISRDSTSFVIVVLDLVILGPILVVVLFLVWRCKRRERTRRF